MCVMLTADETTLEMILLALAVGPRYYTTFLVARWEIAL